MTNKCEFVLNVEPFARFYVIFIPCVSFRTVNVKVTGIVSANCSNGIKEKVRKFLQSVSSYSNGLNHIIGITSKFDTFIFLFVFRMKSSNLNILFDLKLFFSPF